jgi:serine/threonine-protein kinase
MGEVWRATDLALDRTVAVKAVRPALVAEPGFDARFRAEARTMAALSHPHVVNIYDYGRSALHDGSDIAYLVMAYVDGQPLSERIAEAGRLSVPETMSIVEQAAEALHAAHLGGIVHRDVKPANLLIQPNGRVMLVDFGVARSLSATAATTAHAVIGTALYMAPEQAANRGVSSATDVYALGAVAYHCLTGEPPFTGDSALQIAVRHLTDEAPALSGDFPEPARALVSRALAKDPADRYPSAAAFAAAARAAMSDVPLHGWTTGPSDTAPLPELPDLVQPEPHRPPQSRSRRKAPLVGALLVLLLGVAGLLAAFTPGNSDSTAPPPKSTTSVSPDAAPTSARSTRTAPAGPAPHSASIAATSTAPTAGPSAPPTQTHTQPPSGPPPTTGAATPPASQGTAATTPPAAAAH